MADEKSHGFRRPNAAALGMALLAATFFEIVVTILCAAIILAAAFSYLSHGSLMLAAALMGLGIYLAGALVLALIVIGYRLCPFNREGEMRSPSEDFGFQLALALSNFLYRSLGANLLASPYVAMLFYRLSGSRASGPVIHGGKMAVQDPWGVDLGRNVIIGTGASLYSHIDPGNGARFTRTVRIEDDAMVGGHSIILPGVVIGSGAIVLPNSTVTVGTVIQKNEIWGGSPAKYIKDKVVA